MEATKDYQSRSAIAPDTREYIRSGERKRRKKVLRGGQGRKPRKDQSAIRCDNFAPVTPLQYTKNPIEVAMIFGQHKVFKSKSAQIKYLKYLHQCLALHPDWVDNNNWKDDAKLSDVIDTLFMDMMARMEKYDEGGRWNRDTMEFEVVMDISINDGKSSIDATCFVDQIAKGNPELWKLVSAVLGHGMKCGIPSWASEVEALEIEHLQDQTDSETYMEYHGEEIDQSWCNSVVNAITNRVQGGYIYDYHMDCIYNSNDYSINNLEKAIKVYNWPDTFMAKRMYLWMMKGIKFFRYCIKDDVHLGDYVHLSYGEDCPVTPMESYKLEWANDDPINEYVNERMDVDWQNGGEIPLRQVFNVTEGWPNPDNLDTGFVDALNDFIYCGCFLFNFASVEEKDKKGNKLGYRDVVHLTLTKTKRIKIKSDYIDEKYYYQWIRTNK